MSNKLIYNKYVSNANRKVFGPGDRTCGSLPGAIICHREQSGGILSNRPTDSVHLHQLQQPTHQQGRCCVLDRYHILSLAHIRRAAGSNSSWPHFTVLAADIFILSLAWHFTLDFACSLDFIVLLS
uniref:Uncharacterized protein n=1 Tax=Picea glauca TaxID=3330 RepID=A0A101M4W9_PICGL|nr:hypothetical protein ABT39_MTgene997 [Picea glauca]QHR87351.1 hypothetical protein Q903MT_gene1361 [Picea sitchensis]